MSTPETRKAREPLEEPLVQHGELYRYPAGLQGELSNIICRALGKEPSETCVSDDQWRDLGGILARFLAARALRESALRQQDVDRLRAIKQAAHNLIDEIREVVKKHPRAAALLVEWIDDQDIADADFRHHVEFVARLARLDPKASSWHSGPWLTVKDVENSAERPGVFAREPRRDELQLPLDQWWKSTTGLSVDVTEGAPTPYAKFLSALQSPMQMQSPPGASRSAVKKARSKGRKDGQEGTLTEENVEKLRAGLENLLTGLDEQKRAQRRNDGADTESR
jgi:hypothetical protein